jgi:eukaryotic-like serine/threonine-protein kinase
VRAGDYDKGHWWADLAAAAIEAAGGDRELTAQLHRRRGSLLLAQGKLDQALVEFERALGVLRAQDPSREDLDVALALSDVGDTLAALGRYDEALRHHDEASTIKREYFGDDHPGTAAALSNRARVLWGKGELDASLAALEQALAIVRAALGSDHPEVGGYLNNLGVLYEHTGQLEAAEATYIEAIANMQATLGPEHPSVPNALTNLGNVLRQRGRPHEALDKHQQALAIWERALGREHYLFSNALVNIGNAEKDLGQLDDALARYEEALAIRRTAYGQEHPDIAQALEHMADTHVQLGNRRDLAAAQRLYEEAVSLREKLHGDDVQTSDALLGLGITRLRQGRATDAIPPLERCLAIRLAGEHKPTDLVWPRYHLARALWENPLHRERSVELAREALSAIEGVDAATPEEVASIRDWVRNHG